MKLKVKDNPAPTVTINITSSDLTGRKPKKRSAKMVAFRKTRKRRARKNPKGRARRSIRRTRRNPRRKRAVSRGVHRPRLTFKSGKWYGGTSGNSLIKRGAGVRINRRKRRRTRRNPAGIKGLKNMFNRAVLMRTASAGAGIAIGFTAMPLIYRILPSQLKGQRQWLGGIHVLLGLGLAGMFRSRNVKDIGLVIAATGVYDLIAMNVDILGLPPLRTTSPLVNKLIPAAAPAELPAEAASGNLSMTHYGASYPVMAAPVSRVAATGVGANFERVGASYPSLAYPTVGLSGDGGADWDLDGMIN